MIGHSFSLTPVFCYAQQKGYRVISTITVEDGKLVTFWCTRFHRCTVIWDPNTIDPLSCAECNDKLEKCPPIAMKQKPVTLERPPTKGERLVSSISPYLGVRLCIKPNTVYSWICNTNGHRFQAALTPMEREYNKYSKGDYVSCPHCRLADHEATYNVKMVTPCEAGFTLKTRCKWSCNVCSEQVVGSIMNQVACPKGCHVAAQNR